MVSRRICSYLLVLVSLIATTPAMSQVTLGLGGDFFYDNGEIDSEERISLQRTTQEFGYTSDFFVSGSLWATFNITDTLRTGGGIGYYGSYAYVRDNADEDDAPFELGPLLEIVGRFEWLVPLTGDFDLILSAQAGLALLIPDGDLEAEIEALQNQNVGVAGPGVPRLGYMVGPVFGARWRVHEMFAVRTDFSFIWQQLFIFQTEENVNGVPFLLESRADIFRFKFGLSVEVTF